MGIMPIQPILSPNENIHQDIMTDKLNRLHSLVTMINARQTHIVFFTISGHIDSVDISIRLKEDYRVIVMDMTCIYRVKENDETYNRNKLNTLNAMEEVLLKIIHQPHIETMSEIINESGNQFDIFDDDLPF